VLLSLLSFDFTGGKRFGLHLQVNFGIDVGGVEGDVSELCADSVDVDAGAQEVGCGGVPNRVRTHTLVFERWHEKRDFVDVSLDHCVDAKSSDRFATPIEEHNMHGAASAAYQRSEFRHRPRP
jgi:hypothetical protein